MTIEYIELKEDHSNVFWDSVKPVMYLDDNMRITLTDDAFNNYDLLTQAIQKNNRYCLQSLNKENFTIEFMPFASRRLREYLNNNNTTNSQVPLITYYSGAYYVYISHKKISALLKVVNEEVTNEFLEVIDNLYEIT